MRAPLVLALLLVTAAPAFAPDADARTVCSRAVDGSACPSHACLWRNGSWSCERDILREFCLRCWGPDVLP